MLSLQRKDFSNPAAFVAVLAFWLAVHSDDMEGRGAWLIERTILNYFAGVICAGPLTRLWVAYHQPDPPRLLHQLRALGSPV